MEIKQNSFVKAVDDIVESVKTIRLWLMLGLNDMKARYRGSVLGPLWITLALAVSIGGIAFLYAGLFKVSLDQFAPHIAVTLTVWALIQTTISESTNCFCVGANVIKQTALPKFGHIIRLIFRNIFIFGHNLLVVVPVLISFKVGSIIGVLLATLGFLVVVANISWMALIVSCWSAKFKDVPQIIGNSMTFITIMTPVYWMPTMVNERQWITNLNPFYYLLEIIRAPLLGRDFPPHIWYVVLGLTIVGWIIAVIQFAHTRGKIVHWI